MSATTDWIVAGATVLGAVGASVAGLFAYRAADRAAKATETTTRATLALENERRHEELRPDIPSPLIGHALPNSAGQERLAVTIKFERDYWIAADVLFRNSPGLRQFPPRVLGRGEDFVLDLEPLPAEGDPVLTRAIAFKVWPTGGTNNTEDVPCPCNRPEDSGYTGQGHWELRARVEYTPPRRLVVL